MTYYYEYERQYNPDSFRFFPIGHLTTGSRIELTLPVHIKYSGVICEAGHPGWVVKGERKRMSCCGPSWEAPIIILDGIDGLYNCTTIRSSNKEDPNELN